MDATPAPASCPLYPIALHQSTVAGLATGSQLANIVNGAGNGQFGWLSWNGDQNSSALVSSLTPPGTAGSYVNPTDPADHVLTAGDWISGNPGVSNSKPLRVALQALKDQNRILTVPVWDTTTGQDSTLRYHVVSFAQIQITDYRLLGQNRISAIYKGMTTCTP